MIGMFPVKWNQGAAEGLGLPLVPDSGGKIPLVKQAQAITETGATVGIKHPVPVITEAEHG